MMAAVYFCRLFYDLVRTREQTCRHGETKRCRGLQIDHQLETVWLQDRQIHGFVSVQNFRNVSSCLLIASSAQRYSIRNSLPTTKPSASKRLLKAAVRSLDSSRALELRNPIVGISFFSAGNACEIPAAVPLSRAEDLVVGARTPLGSGSSGAADVALIDVPGRARTADC
jgi:hypothetical protein